MDRLDKLINNRTPRKLVLTFLLICLLSALSGWILSAYAADHIVSDQIRSMIAYEGGGKFTAAPQDKYIEKGEEILSADSISSSLSPRLMTSWDSVRFLMFLCIAVPPAIVSLVWLIISLTECSRFFNSIELLRAECISIADNLSSSQKNVGEEYSCVRRLSDSINRLAERFAYLNSSITNDKEFLCDFLTDFSHQLKTSLAVVRLNSDILYEIGDISPEKYESLSDEIQQNLDAMETLIISAIKIAKLNAGAVQYDMQMLDITKTCTKALDRFLPMARSLGINIVKPDDTPVFFMHDSIWLCEAVENLVKNSADHAECSEIKISVSENPSVICITVEDNGKGIPQEEIPSLFRRFGKTSNDHTMRNSGIGMSIAQKIVKAHNGEILVYSEVGSGTRFEISLLKY